MVIFDLWRESIVFGIVFSIIIIIPCILVTLIGKKMIYQLGHWPSKTPIIQMGIFIKLVVVEIITFACLIGFFHFFTST